jgi:hypothetical protein
MRSIRIAEWILELSMTHERAEAVVGDLREAGRGTLWFWRSVLATMIASVWSDFLSAPWRLIAVALGVIAVIGAAQMAVFRFVLQGRATFEVVQWVTWPMNLLAQLACGRWTAQGSGRREIASWLTSTALLGLIDLVFLRVTPYAHWSLLLTVRAYSLTLLGAISARLRPRLVS